MVNLTSRSAKVKADVVQLWLPNALPADTHCVSLVPVFRPNIPKTNPLALEFIFPKLHPGHVLVGTNHDSDNDVRMTRLVVLFLLERLNPTTKGPIFLAVWAIQEKVSKGTKESPEERIIQLAKNTAKRAKESPEERSTRRAKRSTEYSVTRKKLETETVKERNIRILKQTASQRRVRAKKAINVLT